MLVHSFELESECFAPRLANELRHRTPLLHIQKRRVGEVGACFATLPLPALRAISSSLGKGLLLPCKNRVVTYLVRGVGLAPRDSTERSLLSSELRPRGPIPSYSLVWKDEFTILEGNSECIQDLSLGLISASEVVLDGCDRA